MSDLDLLERAHARLTEQRDATNRDGWEGVGYFQRWGGQNQNGDYCESILFDGRSESLVYGLPDAHGELIVTLHRTIDAQLTHLSLALDGARNRAKYGGITGPINEGERACVALARAILEEEQ